jgi:hypothetical protein
MRLRTGTDLVCACQAASGATLAWTTGVGLVITPVRVWPDKQGHKLAVGSPLAKWRRGAQVAGHRLHQTLEWWQQGLFQFLGSGTPRASHSKSRDAAEFRSTTIPLKPSPATEQNKGVLRMAMWLT